MAKEMGASEIDEFLDGPLVTWLSSCLELESKQKITYESLVDGVLVHNVFLQMDLNCQDSEITPSNDEPSLRSRNLKAVLENIRKYYEEELGHVILRLPDVVRLAKEPQLNIREAELLLCLLLGCAVHCPNNEQFIANIRCLDEPTQRAIADCIAQVVHVPDIILSPEMLTRSTGDDVEIHASNVHKAFEQMRQIYRERNAYRDKLRGIARQEASWVADDDDLAGVQELLLDCSISPERDESARRDTETIEWRVKFRAQSRELKERTDDLHECREELMQYKARIDKLQKDYEKLVSEARTAKSYRDELDAANEKAEKADRLEQEIARYKEKLSGVDFYKTRIDELQQDNQLLIESKEVLVDQLNSYKAKADKILDLEEVIFQLKQQINDLSLENASERKRCQELCEENVQLERLLKASTNEALENGFIIDSSDESSLLMDNSLSEQLTNSAQSMALKLELENHRLSNLVDSLKETSFHESSSKLLDLEKDKKKLTLTINSLKEDIKRLSRKNEELEAVSKKALEANEKLQHYQDKNEIVAKYADLEKNHLALVKEKKRLQTLLDGTQKRSVELKRSLDDANRKLEERKVMKDAVNETKIKQKDFESRINALEREKETAMREVEKQRELVKEKLVALESAAKIIEDLEKKLEKLEKQTDDSTIEVSKLKDLVELINNNSYNTVKLKRTPNKTTGNDEKMSVISNKENVNEAKLLNLIESIESQSDHATLKLTNRQLVAEKEILEKTGEKVACEQKRLNDLYDKLIKDYDRVLQDRNNLRCHLREAKSKLRQQNESIEHLEDECNNLKSNSLRKEHAELKDDFGKLYRVNEVLKVEYCKVKVELGQLTSKHKNDKQEMLAKNEKIIELELEVNKMKNRCEALAKVNEVLDRDKRSLMDHVSQLIKQNQELITQSLEDREHYHNEERNYTDKMNNLSRQKEKLEEKIMDQYRRLENSTTKKKTSIVKSTFFKVRRAGSELFSRSRRSWAEENTVADERSYDFEYSRGHESDVSLDVHRLRAPRESCVSDFGCSQYPKSRKSVDFLDNFRPSDFTFGTNDNCLDPKSRKSIDFLDFSSENNNNDDNNNNEDELDITLHESSGDCTNTKLDQDVSLFPMHKSIDLSFEEDQRVIKENNNEIIDVKKNNIEGTKIPQYNWSEYGCV